MPGVVLRGRDEQSAVPDRPVAHRHRLPAEEADVCLLFVAVQRGRVEGAVLETGCDEVERLVFRPVAVDVGEALLTGDDEPPLLPGDDLHRVDREPLVLGELPDVEVVDVGAFRGVRELCEDLVERAPRGQRPLADQVPAVVEHAHVRGEGDRVGLILVGHRPDQLLPERPFQQGGAVRVREPVGLCPARADLFDPPGLGEHGDELVVNVDDVVLGAAALGVADHLRVLLIGAPRQFHEVGAVALLLVGSVPLLDETEVEVVAADVPAGRQVDDPVLLHLACGRRQYGQRCRRGRYPPHFPHYLPPRASSATPRALSSALPSSAARHSTFGCSVSWGRSPTSHAFCSSACWAPPPTAMIRTRTSLSSSTRSSSSWPSPGSSWMRTPSVMTTRTAWGACSFSRASTPSRITSRSGVGR